MADSSAKVPMASPGARIQAGVTAFARTTRSLVRTLGASDPLARLPYGQHALGTPARDRGVGLHGDVVLARTGVDGIDRDWRRVSCMVSIAPDVSPAKRARRAQLVGTHRGGSWVRIIDDERGSPVCHVHVAGSIGGLLE